MKKNILMVALFALIIPSMHYAMEMGDHKVNLPLLSDYESTLFELMQVTSPDEEGYLQCPRCKARIKLYLKRYKERKFHQQDAKRHLKTNTCRSTTNTNIRTSGRGDTVNDAQAIQNLIAFKRYSNYADDGIAKTVAFIQEKIQQSQEKARQARKQSKRRKVDYSDDSEYVPEENNYALTFDNETNVECPVCLKKYSSATINRHVNRAHFSLENK